MSTLLAADVLAACSALGHYDGNRYYPDDQCLETAKDLMRFLRRDDATHEMRRLLGDSQVLQSDLLPLMKETANQAEFFDITLRLVVNLTTPALMLYKERLPKDKIERNHFLQVLGHLQQYKHAFAEDRCQVWDVIREKMNDVLQIDFSEREEDQNTLVERCLILIRNMLNVPTDPSEEHRPDNDANLHDKLLWSLHTSGIKLIILYLASNKAEHAYYMYVLEIMSLMLREQIPEVLASANFNRSEQEKERDEKALAAVAAAEQKAKLLKIRNAARSRHSRFGGTFTVLGLKAIGQEDLIVHRQIKSVKSDINFDLDKKLLKTPKNKRPIIEETCERRSAFTIRLMLKEFCVEFLSGAYNFLMSTVKGMLDRQAAQANDETYYLWGIKFFMEFNRHYGFKVELVSETMNVAMFHFITMQIGNCQENMITDKERARLWAARLHVATRAYGELLLTLCAMDKDPNSSVRSSAKIFKSNIFYLAEYREILLSLLINYNEIKFSDRCLKDIIESTHVFLKLLEAFSSSRSLLVVETVSKKHPKKKTKSTSRPSIPNKQQWTEISGNLAEIISTSEIDPGSYCPFDSTLNIDIDDQKADAMCKVQKLMHQRDLVEAVGTLRAAREVWPENDIFGGASMTPEEELQALREIFEANIQPEASLTPPPGDSEEEEEGPQSPQFVSSEKSFDFKDFLSRYAHVNVIRSCGLLLKRFQSNSVFTNHCVCKLLHRVAFTLKRPTMLFQVSLFMTFQKILKSDDRHHKELIKFVRFIMMQLKVVADKNATVFREMLFWKNNNVAEHIESGSDRPPQQSSKLKQAWADEEEEELRRLYEEYQITRPPVDVSTWILANLIRKDRTKQGLNKKLREFGYLAPKAARVAPSAQEWTPEEETELREQYEQYKDNEDPIAWIVLALTVPRKKRDVLNKMLELGLITNKAQAQKKTVESGPVQYKSAEFVEDDDTSSSDDDEPAAATAIVPWPQQRIRIKQCAKLCKEMDGAESLAWLVEQLKNEVEERRDSLDDPDDCDSLLLPDATKISTQFETDTFKDLFTSMGLVQDVFLKIPAKMSLRLLVDIADEIQKVLSAQDLPPEGLGRPVPRDDFVQHDDENADDNLQRARGSSEGGIYGSSNDTIVLSSDPVAADVSLSQENSKTLVWEDISDDENDSPQESIYGSSEGISDQVVEKSAASVPESPQCSKTLVWEDMSDVGNDSPQASIYGSSEGTIFLSSSPYLAEDIPSIKHVLSQKEAGVIAPGNSASGSDSEGSVVYPENLFVQLEAKKSPAKPTAKEHHKRKRVDEPKLEAAVLLDKGKGKRIPKTKPEAEAFEELDIEERENTDRSTAAKSRRGKYEFFTDSSSCGDLGPQSSVEKSFTTEKQERVGTQKKVRKSTPKRACAKNADASGKKRGCITILHYDTTDDSEAEVISLSGRDVIESSSSGLGTSQASSSGVGASREHMLGGCSSGIGTGLVASASQKKKGDSAAILGEGPSADGMWSDIIDLGTDSD